jgi:cell division protein FtsL
MPDLCDQLVRALHLACPMWWTFLAILLLIQVVPAFGEEIQLVDDDQQRLALQKEIAELETQISDVETQLNATDIEIPPAEAPAQP